MSIDACLIKLVVALAAAKLFAEAAGRFRQTAVLGELLAGIVLGAALLGTAAAHAHWLAPFVFDPREPFLKTAAEIGVILLMFEAGLESDLDSLLRVGRSAFWVACVGVALPFAGGYAVMHALGGGTAASIVVGAALTATSVGISARAFSDLGRSGSTEAQIVLGAAVIDDVIGLIVLAVVSGLVATGTLSPALALRSTLVATAFLAACIVIGRRFAPALLRVAARMQARAALSTAALLFCFVLAVAAHKAAGLSPIVGAFAAGLVLAGTEHRVHLEQRLRPVADVFIPLFFVAVGAAMPFGHWNAHLALVVGLLTAVAIGGKILAGLIVPHRSADPLAVGIGMVPRGEVGLVFAAYGLSSGAIGAADYTAILTVVMLTTLVAPILLGLRLRAHLPAPAAPSQTAPAGAPSLIGETT